MEISKSTPYVRYRENISSTLHKGTIHIESEYLDRERKTTIESIEGQTWQNMVNGENKEEDILPKLGLKIEVNEDVLDSKEQHMPIDTIIGDVEPVANEDGTYTYEISTMEGSYAKTLDGENNFSLTSDGLVGDMYIKYNAQGEEVNGSIVMDNWQSSYTIENSNNGEIKSAILTGQTLVNMTKQQEKEIVFNQRYQKYAIANDIQPGGLIHGEHIYMSMEVNIHELNIETPLFQCTSARDTGGHLHIVKSFDEIKNIPKNTWVRISTIRLVNKNESLDNYSLQFGLEGEHPTTAGEQIARVSFRNPIWINLTKIYGNGNEPTLTEYDNIPYFKGMQSVKMPVLATTGKNLFDSKDFCEKLGLTHLEGGFLCNKATGKYPFKTNGRTCMTLKHKGDSNAIEGKSIMQINYTDGTIAHTSLAGLKYVFSKPIESIQVNSWLQGTVEVTEIMWYEVNEGETIHLDYEPFKSNILTVNEEVELRKVGDVQDELDLETGTLTQRIGEIVLDGSENEQWVEDAPVGNTNRYLLTVDNLKYIDSKYSDSLMCDKWRVFKPIQSQTENQEGIYVNGWMKKIHIGVDVNRLPENSLNGFKQWLSNNPLIVQYLFNQDVTKTVDLTIKDQDDKIIQSLHTHPSTTHINLSSNGLIPSAEINYTMYGNIGEATGEQITDGTDSKLIEGKIYGETLQNVLPSASLKNSMDYNTSTQKLNNGYDNVVITDVEFKEVTLYGQTMVNIEGMKSVENPTIIITNSPMRFGKGGRK